MAYEKITNLEDLWEGDMETYDTLDGTEVLLIGLKGGRVKAYQAMCPHQKILLSEGSYEDGVIMCRAHLWSFDDETGVGINPKNCHLTEYPTKLVDNDVFIDIEGLKPSMSSS